MNIICRRNIVWRRSKIRKQEARVCLQNAKSPLLAFTLVLLWADQKKRKKQKKKKKINQLNFVLSKFPTQKYN